MRDEPMTYGIPLPAPQSTVTPVLTAADITNPYRWAAYIPAPGEPTERFARWFQRAREEGYRRLLEELR